MSMINHTDMESEASKSQIDPFYYENTYKETILEPSHPQPQPQISNEIDLIFEIKLQNFDFKPTIENKAKSYKMDFDLWQKSII